MFIDVFNRFSDKQALTATALGSNEIDLGVDGNLGIGTPMAVVITLGTAADDADADETYTVELQSDSDVGFGTAKVIQSAVIERGAPAGSKVVVHVPASTSADRYLRLNYVLGGTSPSVEVTAFLIPVNMIDNYVDYKDAAVIS